MKKVYNLNVIQLASIFQKYYDEGILFLDLEIPENENKIKLSPSTPPKDGPEEDETIISAA